VSAVSKRSLILVNCYRIMPMSTVLLFGYCPALDVSDKEVGTNSAERTSLLEL
jgi:hypothetical protein